MYEVSCHDLGIADCEFDLMAYSLERLEFDILNHARHCHPKCAGVDAPAGSPERRALHERIVAAARLVAAEEALV